MESRYALRELEGAIGYDCRRLECGRPAKFRHTSLHRRARREFFERRDAIMILQGSFLAAASMASSSRGNVMDSAMGAMDRDRKLLMEVAFPYIPYIPQEDAVNDEDDYSALFDELDRLNGKNRETEADSGSDGSDSGDGIGDGGGK